jgi:hypothetical protein
MGYQTAHYYKHGNPNNCVSYTMYVPDGGNLRSQITNVYNSLFGRWGEPAGVEGWVNVWNAPGDPAHSGFASVYSMVLSGAGGELAGVNANGRHTGLSTGGCPVYGCTDPRASNYNPNADINNGTCSYPTPSISFSINPTNYIAPNSATLTWSVSGATSQSIDQGIGSVNSSGSLVVSPNNSRSYKLDASYYGITSATRTVDLTVYQPVNVSISSVPASIITGGIAQLTWVTSGDASSASIDQGVGAVLLSSSRNVSPSVTTTYTLSASGLGGSDTDSATVTVYQRPTLSASAPTVIDYDGTFSTTVTTEYANNGVSASYIFNYLDGSTDTAVVNGSLNGDSTTPGISVTQDLSTIVPWTDFGPGSIIVTFTATGDGGIVNQSNTINVNIDQLPDNITIPENLDELPEDQVEAPDVETVLSDPIVITGIDIPVTIKSNFPIQVRFDDDPDIESNWKNVQQI